jgi:NAD(P)-dependent dehydrogenase (short-subunit alcohol dehydrogenase family)
MLTWAPGIGVAIAEAIAAKGANLVLNYTSPSSKDPTEKLAEDLRSKYGNKILVVQADLGTPEGPRALIETIKKDLSPLQVDIIVNNAGVAHNNRLENVTLSDFDTTYKVNVLGPLLLVQAAQPYLPKDRSGRIVNVSSVSSTMGFVGQSVYGGTKAAVEAMTRTWARELSENCTVNAINPGPVLTEMYAGNTEEFKRLIKPFIQHSPLMRARPGIDAEELVQDEPHSGGRPAYCSEIAGVITMLLSEESSWCTGQVISANGGMIFGLQ